MSKTRKEILMRLIDDFEDTITTEEIKLDYLIAVKDAGLASKEGKKKQEVDIDATKLNIKDKQNKLEWFKKQLLLCE